MSQIFLLRAKQGCRRGEAVPATQALGVLGRKGQSPAPCPGPGLLTCCGLTNSTVGFICRKMGEGCPGQSGSGKVRKGMRVHPWAWPHSRLRCEWEGGRGGLLSRSVPSALREPPGGGPAGGGGTPTPAGMPRTERNGVGASVRLRVKPGQTVPSITRRPLPYLPHSPLTEARVPVDPGS